MSSEFVEKWKDPTYMTLGIIGVLLSMIFWVEIKRRQCTIVSVHRYTAIFLLALLGTFGALYTQLIVPICAVSALEAKETWANQAAWKQEADIWLNTTQLEQQTGSSVPLFCQYVPPLPAKFLPFIWLFVFLLHALVAISTFRKPSSIVVRFRYRAEIEWCGLVLTHIVLFSHFLPDIIDMFLQSTAASWYSQPSFIFVFWHWTILNRHHFLELVEDMLCSSTGTSVDMSHKLKKMKNMASVISCFFLLLFGLELQSSTPLLQLFVWPHPFLPPLVLISTYLYLAFHCLSLIWWVVVLPLPSMSKVSQEEIVNIIEPSTGLVESMSQESIEPQTTTSMTTTVVDTTTPTITPTYEPSGNSFLRSRNLPRRSSVDTRHPSTIH